jgi:hypothetical protein
MKAFIAKFRRIVVDFVRLIISTVEGWLKTIGRRFKGTRWERPHGRLSRIVPLQIINPDSSEEDELALQQEMKEAWEKDWATL